MNLKLTVIVSLYYSDGRWSYSELSGDFTRIIVFPVPVRPTSPAYIHKSVAAATMLGYNDVQPRYPGGARCVTVAAPITKDLLGIFGTFNEARAFVVALPRVPSETC